VAVAVAHFHLPSSIFSHAAVFFFGLILFPWAGGLTLGLIQELSSHMHMISAF
jgi:hypothetical protein